MKKLSKFLSVLMALIMTISIIPLSSITASAETITGTCSDNLTWEFDEASGTLTISGTGYMYHYASNNRPWESYKDSIKSVVIDAGVTRIGEYAFYDCKSLTNVTIGDSVTTIFESAFYYCTSLTSITVDSNNQYYSSDEYGVLFNKDKTTLIQYPIGNTINSYIIPDSVITIGEDAFGHCTSLTSVTIPDSVTSIGEAAFAGCDSLKNVTLLDGVTTIGGYAFAYCTSLTSVTIPDSVITIGDYAFAYCTSLESITIPNSVISIDYGAFYDCTSLTDVYYSCTEKQWNSVVIDNMEDFNAPLRNATIHYSGHSNNWVTITEVTCEKDGVRLGVCSSCGEVNYDVTEATGHSYESVVVAPTCTMQGYTAYTCECGDTYYEDYTDALGHTEEILPAVAPTCTKTGLTEGEKCTACNEIIVAQEVVEANGHNYTITETSATCTQIGYVTCVCDCGDTYISTIIPATGHSFVDGTCENCSEKESGGNSDVNCTIHTYTWETVVEASCTQRGVCIGTCSVCEDAVVDYHDATGHNMVNGDCTNCDYTENNEPSQPNEPSEPTDPSEECDCNCHKGGFFWKFVLFFQKLFGANKTCSCGVAHY